MRPSEHLQTAARLSVPAGLEQVLPWPRPGRDFKPPTANINEEEQLVSKSNLGQRILLGRNKISGQYECLSSNSNLRLESGMSPFGQAAWLMSPTDTDPSVQLQLTCDIPATENNPSRLNQCNDKDDVVNLVRISQSDSHTALYGCIFICGV